MPHASYYAAGGLGLVDWWLRVLREQGAKPSVEVLFKSLCFIFATLPMAQTSCMPSPSVIMKGYYKRYVYRET